MLLSHASARIGPRVTLAPPAIRQLKNARATLHSFSIPRPKVQGSTSLLRNPQQVVFCRHESSIGDKPKRGMRISHLFGGLVGLGMLVTIYGLLEWYFSLQIWPEPVRSPLKAALKAKAQGDHERADGYFRKAIEAALSLPPSALEPSPLLKLSGIYISLATMHETAGQPIRAFSDLREALALFGPDPLSSTPQPATAWSTDPLSIEAEDQTRAIGLAQKLGQLAARMGAMPTPPPFPILAQDASAPIGWDNAAEQYLSAALTAMLRIGLASRAADATTPVVAGRDVVLDESTSADGSDGDDIESGRVNRRGLGMTMESLAEVYARRGRPDLAGQLLSQAVSTLIPPQVDSPPVYDRCQAAMLMTAISTHALDPRTPQAVKASRSWSLRALQIAEGAARDAGWSSGTPIDTAAATCARAQNVALYNLGMLAEVEKNSEDAAKYFTRALAVARESGFTEGRREAIEALRRVRAVSGEK